MIRRIGDRVLADTNKINKKRKKMEKKLDEKFISLKKDAETLLNMINEEANNVDKR